MLAEGTIGIQENGKMILSRLVDTFSTRILYPRQLLSFSRNYSIAVV